MPASRGAGHSVREAACYERQQMRSIDTSRRQRTAPRVKGSVRAAPGVVVAYHKPGQNPRCHESITRDALAQKLAALKGYAYGGEFDSERKYGSGLYFVPGDTITGADAARALGIGGEDDLFGGVVPFPFVATKSITHPLADIDAFRPAGWSTAFPDAVRDAVLPGYSAFSHEDARRAGRRLLRDGPVRVKPALGAGGRGQVLAADEAALDAALTLIDAGELARCGLALEQHMTGVTTYSVGQVRVADLIATYFGTQKLTRGNDGAEVYGGSALTVVRGDFDALLALDADDATRVAVEQARVYDDAARRCFHGFFASRRNYDIVRGRNARGETVSGVLEQSWRIGGASGAEVAALEAFRADRGLTAVRAECTEVYGEGAVPPPRATVYFRGLDPDVGFISKYTTLEPHADA